MIRSNARVLLKVARRRQSIDRCDDFKSLGIAQFSKQRSFFESGRLST